MPTCDGACYYLSPFIANRVGIQQQRLERAGGQHLQQERHQGTDSCMCNEELYRRCIGARGCGRQRVRVHWATFDWQHSALMLAFKLYEDGNTQTSPSHPHPHPHIPRTHTPHTGARMQTPKHTPGTGTGQPHPACLPTNQSINHTHLAQGSHTQLAYPVLADVQRHAAGVEGERLYHVRSPLVS